MTFATNILNDCNDRIAALTTDIQDLERQLDAKREHLKKVEAEKQQLETVAGAGESAIEQVQKFLGLAQLSERPDMANALWEALDQIRNQQPPTAELEPAPQPEPPAPPSSDDSAPSDPEPTNAVVALPPASTPTPQSAGAAAKDYTQWRAEDLKSEWDSTGKPRDEVRKFGDLRAKQTWIDALNAQ